MEILEKEQLIMKLDNFFAETILNFQRNGLKLKSEFLILRDQISRIKKNAGFVDHATQIMIINLVTEISNFDLSIMELLKIRRVLLDFISSNEVPGQKEISRSEIPSEISLFFDKLHRGAELFSDIELIEHLSTISWRSLETAPKQLIDWMR